MKIATILFAALLITIAILPSAIDSQSTTTTTSPTATKNPEECAIKIYNTIKAHKGSKDDLYRKLEEQFNVDMKNIKPNEFSNEAFRKTIDLVVKKIIPSDPITADEFKRFAETLIQKWRATNTGR